MIKITSKELYQQLYKQTGGDKLISIIDNYPNINNYRINNHRDICAVNLVKNICNQNVNCNWVNSQCKLALTTELLIKFVNRISYEFIENGLKKEELFQNDQFFVSDIVDYNKFIERKGQRVINNQNMNIKQILENIFSKNIPLIGKKNIYEQINYQELNLENSLKDLDKYYIQNIIENNNTIYRAFANAIFWKKNNLQDKDIRNLGYYSVLQTNLSNYFKSLVIDWLIDKRNESEINKNLVKEKYLEKNIVDFVIDIGNDIQTFTNCIVELYILGKKYKQLIYIYNENSKLIYIYDYEINKILKSNFNKKYLDIKIKKSGLHFIFNYTNHSFIPDNIDVLYFK